MDGTMPKEMIREKSHALYARKQELEGALADAAPFQITRPEDLQPPHNLDLLRGKER